MDAGTIALQMLCETRGWNYERWRGVDRVNVDAISLWSLEMGLSDEDQLAM